MMFRNTNSIAALSAVASAAAAFASPGYATQSAVGYPVYSGISQGTACCGGVTAMAVGRDGNYYGANTYQPSSPWGIYTLFRVTPDGAYSVIHRFDDQDHSTGVNNEGINVTSLISAPDGSLLGSAFNGGAHNGGTLFRESASGQFAVLHTFTQDDGFEPQCIVRAHDGTLYGSTESGGANGYGTLFKLQTDGTFTKLHDFAPTGAPSSGSNGCPALAPDGSLFGTTVLSYSYKAGNGRLGSGIYRLSPSGSFTVLRRFSVHGNGFDTTGNFPDGATLLAKGGDFYGVLQNFYLDASSAPTSHYQVYRISPKGAYSVVATMDELGAASGSNQVSLLTGRDGSLYGKRWGWGDTSNVFRIAADGTYSDFFYAFANLNWFTGTQDPQLADGFGSMAWALDGDGNIIAASTLGGSTVIDRIVPTGDMTASATATPGAISVGTPVDLSWITTGASSCAFIGDVPNAELLGVSQPFSGSLTTTTTLSSGDYTFALECNDAQGGIIRSLLPLVPAP